MLDIFSWVVSPGGQGAKAPQKDADGFHEPQDDEQTRPNSVFSFGKFRTWSGRSLSKLQEIPRELVRWNILDILPKNEPSSDGCVSMRFPASSKPSDTAGWNTSQSGLSYRNLQDRSVLGDLFDIAASYVRTMPQVVADAMPLTMKLTLYGLYKQGTEGALPNTEQRPLFYQPINRYKHDAWHVWGNMSMECARAMYVDTVAISIIVERLSNDALDEVYCGLLGSEDPPPFLGIVYNKKIDPLPRTWELAIQFGCAVDDFIEMSDNLSDQQKAEIKGLSMQAMCGDNFYYDKYSVTSPIVWSVLSGPEWEAWNSLRGMAREEAMQAYIQAVRDATDSE